MASNIPESQLVVVESPEGHDGFLLEFKQVNRHISEHLKIRLPELYAGEPLESEDVEGEERGVEDKFAVKRDSLIGEAEADVTAW